MRAQLLEPGLGGFQRGGGDLHVFLASRLIGNQQLLALVLLTRQVELRLLFFELRAQAIEGRAVGFDRGLVQAGVDLGEQFGLSSVTRRRTLQTVIAGRPAPTSPIRVAAGADVHHRGLDIAPADRLGGKRREQLAAPQQHAT